MPHNSGNVTVARHCPEHPDGNYYCRACSYFEGFRAAESRAQRIIEKAQDDFNGYDHAHDDTRAEFAAEVVEAFAAGLIATIRKDRD